MFALCIRSPFVYIYVVQKANVYIKGERERIIIQKTNVYTHTQKTNVYIYIYIHTHVRLLYNCTFAFAFYVYVRLLYNRRGTRKRPFAASSTLPRHRPVRTEKTNPPELSRDEHDFIMAGIIKLHSRQKPRRPQGIGGVRPGNFTSYCVVVV